MCVSSPEASEHLNEHLIGGYINDLNTEQSYQRQETAASVNLQHNAQELPSMTGDKQGSNAPGTGLKLDLLSST